MQYYFLQLLRLGDIKEMIITYIYFEELFWDFDFFWETLPKSF